MHFGQAALSRKGPSLGVARSLCVCHTHRVARALGEGHRPDDAAFPKFMTGSKPLSTRFKDAAAGGRKRQGLASFSLIEVALALGIISFCVISLFGLMTVAMQESKSSQEDTALALAAKYILSDLRQKPYTNLVDQLYVFDYQGVPVAASQAGFYTSTVTILPSPFSSIAAWAADNPSMVGIKLVFTWQGQNASKPNAETFITALSGY